MGLFARELLDLCDELSAESGGHRVNDEHALVTDLHRGVDAITVEHPDVALHVERMHLVVHHRSGLLDSADPALAGAGFAAGVS